MTNPTMLSPGGVSQKIDLIQDATISASDVTTAFGGIGYFTQATFLLKTGVASGTSPTLNVYIQILLADGSTWADAASFTQIDSSTQKYILVYNPSASASAVWARSDGTLTAGTFKSIPLTGQMRAKYVVGGTSPSFANVTLCAYFRS